MKTFLTITDARNGIMDLGIAGVPADLLERYRTLRGAPSPVDQIVGLGEFIYAKRDQFPAEIRELGGGLISIALINYWHGLDVDDRGTRIIQAFARDLGEPAPQGSTWPDTSTDPEVLFEYRVPATTTPLPEQTPTPASPSE